jgi:hypothetical protein
MTAAHTTPFGACCGACSESRLVQRSATQRDLDSRRITLIMQALFYLVLGGATVCVCA